MDKEINNEWAFILGGSSGFGLATAKILASKGFNIFIVHRDRKTDLESIEEQFNEIKSKGVAFKSVNVNASTSEGQEKILNELDLTSGNGGKIKLFLFAIADGNINPVISSGERELDEEDFLYTIKSMGTSFVNWSKLLLKASLFSKDARIVGLTSVGCNQVLPYYAAVSASKAVLESACKYLAVEFASSNITVNLINAGITDTNALRAIPNYKELIEKAINKNPYKRLTQPADIANVIYLLTRDEAKWINGEVIRVDGGEQLAF